GSRQIDIDNLTPFVDGQFFDCAGRRIAGVVNERVDPAELAHGVFDDFLRVFRISDVAYNRQSAADDVGGDFQIDFGARGENDVIAPRGEFQRDRPADAFARAGDDG